MTMIRGITQYVFIETHRINMKKYDFGMTYLSAEIRFTETENTEKYSTENTNSKIIKNM